MTSQYDLKAQKPTKFWNRELSISPKDFFGSLSKAIISGVFSDSKGAVENIYDIFKDIKVEESPEYAAWLLIYNALLQSLAELINEYKELFDNDFENFSQQEMADELESALDEINEIHLDDNFFNQPSKFKLLEDLEKPLVQWLCALGMCKAEATALHWRLKRRFVLALHQQWLAKPQRYACIEEALYNPFKKATRHQRGWIQYRAWLQEQPNERMFAEAFSLNQVFVPLRAYYTDEVKVDSGRANNLNVNSATKEYDIVVDLQKNLEQWVSHFHPDNAVKIIRGGPGSGKSSFAKMFAAFIAENREDIPVLFVPLHRFNLSADLIEAMNQFIKNDRYLTINPLSGSDGEERLLIIFDGLDELSMQGKAAEETAQFFVDEVINTINYSNSQKLKYQALITGRDLVVQAASNKLRKKSQILHILPYLVTENTEKNGYVDRNNLLSIDQRDIWWKKYGIAKGMNYEGIPNDLTLGRLVPITREPLLNYLVALSYERKKIKFSSWTTLNTIYNDLLNAVYQRQWDHGRHESTKHLEIYQYIRVLEEIALAVWHGNGRTATVEQIFKRCENSKLVRYLEYFQEGSKKGISRLLTAFYFRQSDHLQAGDKTFEFTHKSFGEYLTARRIVREVKNIHEHISNHDQDPDKGFDEKEALRRWAELCGPTKMDEYIYQFLINEIASHVEHLEKWQNTFSRLISFAVRFGLPMEKTEALRFTDMMRESRNAEEALVVVYHACAINTQKIVDINWGENNDDCGKWIKRLQEQRNFNEYKLINRCLAFINFSGCNLVLSDFHSVNLSGSKLESTDLKDAVLVDANLKRANLKEADLKDANLQRANLEEAYLYGADLERACLLYANLEAADLEAADLGAANLEQANFRQAHLERAQLKEANLELAQFKGANLEGANLEAAYLYEADLEATNLKEASLIGTNLAEANLDAANLQQADLKRANLERANLQGANLAGTFLEKANLEEANLKAAYLSGASLEGASLEGANLQGANLQGTYLKGANLKAANLLGASLEEANLEGANLEMANLKGTNLEGANLEGTNVEGTYLE